MLDKLTMKEFIDSGFSPRSQTAFLESKLAKNYHDFLEALHLALDSAVAKLCEGRHVLKGQNENQLTFHITTALSHMGFDATFDTAVNGHCDITVKDARGYLWLGEAKIHKGSYDWLFEGYNQLVTRYASGLPNQDGGGLLIYTFKDRADQMMTRWAAHITKKQKGLTSSQCSLNRMCFFTEGVQEATGIPMKVRHIPVPLYFRPLA
ncbi:hypothetical protein [Azospirillum sp. SYSU D00513]|uniref:hypothetical protein n=1 Tax=Azospirillum sp. SYSU D00513 TaxID=2812561 RepID=UPI001A9599C5|nr:hypothetical protein [Azospirillum sp. SYSU D00513]